MAFKFNLGNFRRGLGIKQAPLHFAPILDRDMIYRDHHLEQKSLMVGWQITVTRHEAVIWHTSISGTLDAAITEARNHIDTLFP